MIRNIIRKASTTPIADFSANPRKITLIPGDGVGPEVMFATKHVISAAGANIKYDTHHVGELLGYDELVLQKAIDSLQETKVCMKGWVLASKRMDANHKMSMQMKMNHEIGTFVGVSHVHSYEGIDGKHKNVDFITIRETTEGEYKGMEHQTVPGVVESLKVMSRESCERIARFAFDYALKHGRKKVTTQNEKYLFTKNY